MRFSISFIIALALVGAAYSPAVAGLPVGGGGLDPTYSAPSPTPPEKFATSPGGVDMRTGTFEYDHLDLNVGGLAEQGGLDLRRTPQSSSTAYRGRFGSFNHNWDITITEKRVKFYTSLYPSQFDYVISVNFGGRSTSFQARYTAIAAFEQLGVRDKATLTYTGTKQAAVYTYTANDGTVVKFRQISKECSTISPLDSVVRRCAFASEVTVPSGQRYNLAYDSAGAGDDMSRLRNVTSNSGHALVFEYNPPSAGYHLISKACALNLATSSMPTTPVCPASPQSVATYTYSSQFMTAMTDATGSAYTFSRTGTGSPYAESYTRPGDAQPYLVNQTYPSPNPYENASRTIGSQQFTNGPSYTYNWTEMSQLGEEPQPQIVGGSVTNNLGGTLALNYGFYYSPFYKDSSLNATAGPEKIIDELGRTTTATYCPTGATSSTPTYNSICGIQRMISRTYPDGNSALFEYNAQRLPSKVTRRAKSGTGLTDTIELATYTCIASAGCDKPLTITDAKGNVTNYTYDPVHGGVLTATLPAATPGGVRPQKRYAYGQFFAQAKNSSGVLVANSTGLWMPTQVSECKTLASCAGTADETLTTFSYGAAGTVNQLLLTGTTVRAGDNSVSSTTGWTYDAVGNRLTEDGPLPGATDTRYWFYDLMRRMIGEISPDPDGAGALKHRAVRNTYDAAGRLTKVERGTVTGTTLASLNALTVQETLDTTYDLMDRKLREAKSAGVTTYALSQYSYDAVGRLECSAVRMNPAAYTALPPSACTLGTEGTNGPDRITKLTYNVASELIKTTVALGTANQADDETNTYTLNGKLASVTDGENNTTTFDYDGHDRLSKTRYPVAAVGALASSTTDFEQLTYDANGNTIQRRLRDGQLHTLSYDNLNRLTLKDVPNTVFYENDTSYTYDLMGRTTFAGNTTTRSVWYGYDALGRMTSESANFGTTSRSYDNAGRLIKLTHPDGFFVNYDYDTVGNITTIRENNATSGTGVLASYTYDDYGRRTSLTRGNGVVTNFIYDGASRLTGFGHDLAGTVQDLSVTGFSYNPANQILSYSRSNDSYAWKGHYNVSRSYGTNGLNQLTSAGATALSYDGRGNLTGSGASAYTYTSENRLATGPGGAALAYDSTGRLSQVYTPALSTNFDYDGAALIGERDQTSYALLRRYVHGPGEDQPLVWYEGAGLTDKRYLMTDERGSVVAVTNNTGAASGINSYDEYGIPASTNVGRFGYTGQTWIPEIGLNYYKARMYSPTLGRFMQTDPIGYKDGVNWYDYVDGDPVNRSDPTGLCLNCIAGGIGAVVGGVVSGGAELIDQALNEREINWREVGKETASGAVGGAVTGFTGNPALGGAAQSAASDIINGKTPSLSNTLTGAAGGFIGGKIGDRFTRAAVGNQRFGAMVAKPGIFGILSRNGKVALRAAENSREGLRRVAGQVFGESAANAIVPSGEEIVVIGRRVSPSIEQLIRGCFGMCDGKKD